jgi:hypothetical protein
MDWWLTQQAARYQPAYFARFLNSVEQSMKLNASHFYLPEKLQVTADDQLTKVDELKPAQLAQLDDIISHLISRQQTLDVVSLLHTRKLRCNKHSEPTLPNHYCKFLHYHVPRNPLFFFPIPFTKFTQIVSLQLAVFRKISNSKPDVPYEHEEANESFIAYQLRHANCYSLRTVTLDRRYEISPNGLRSNKRKMLTLCLSHRRTRKIPYTFFR